VVGWAILQGCDRFFEGTGLLIYFVELALSSLGGFLVFAALVTQIELPEVDIFMQRIRQRFGR
jgi:putative peptidoglycan lipid II flippase